MGSVLSVPFVASIQGLKPLSCSARQALIYVVLLVLEPWLMRATHFHTTGEPFDQTVLSRCCSISGQQALWPWWCFQSFQSPSITVRGARARGLGGNPGPQLWRKEGRGRGREGEREREGEEQARGRRKHVQEPMPPQQGGNWSPCPEPLRAPEESEERASTTSSVQKSRWLAIQFAQSVVNSSRPMLVFEHDKNSPTATFSLLQSKLAHNLTY